jgi:PhnB protein
LEQPAASARPGAQPSSTIALSISLDSTGEQWAVLAKLSAGGTIRIRMALHETFWGARFGMLTDKFGIDRTLNCARTKK